MPWSGRYYYRSIRVNGQPRRLYVGPGLIGQLAEQTDRIGRERRLLHQFDEKFARDVAEAVDRDVAAVDRLADALVRAALLAAGCHQHHRGEWRRKREAKAS